MRTIFPTFLLSFLLMVSCTKKTETVSNPKDYNAFLESNDKTDERFAVSEIDFWQKKIDANPNQITYLSQIATNYSKLFEITGNINHLYKAEKLLVKSNEAFKYSSVATIRSLARNYISQHRFKEALVLANKALAIGEGLKETQKLLFDVQMELGNYDEANKNLTKLHDIKDFDYLIRMAKWNDHLGDIYTTVSLMEQAAKIAEDNENKYLKVWTYSNLGDYCGHAGRIKEAYNYYLKALRLDPQHSYSLKGISWIIFSHEKNTNEANRVINIISKKHNSPDFYLLKAEIAEYEHKTAIMKENNEAYFAMLSKFNYGAMYNKYNALIFADSQKEASKALEIAKIEVDHRPTPDSYDLLAWAYYNIGDVKKALEISQKHVEGKSFEPELTYHLAMIYKANNKTDRIPEIKKELLASIFELGPNMETKINQL
jgi:tetratricopeptide (TPR) repeat protein